MADYVLSRAADRFRPQQGWLAFALLLGALACLVLSVLAVEWVERDSVVVWAVFLGFLCASWLAQRGAPAGLAWGVLVVVGAALAVVLTAELAPPAVVWRGGAAQLDSFWTRQLALFGDRVAGWWRAVGSGGRSTETIVFTLGLALAGWFVGAFLAWSSYRLARPYWGLTLVGLALAVNTFYGQAPLYWAVFFFGLAITAATYVTYLRREIEWERDGMDYSAEVRLDLLVYAAGISLGIMSLALALPSINFRAVAEAFQRQEAVMTAEQTLERAFAGVQQPRTDEGALGGGGLPRGFLLNGDPGLTTTVVMTATARLAPDAPPGTLAAYHWRSVSYDVYTGRGWRRSSEREEPIDAGESIAPATSGTTRVETTVDWVYDQRATRYTIGRPVTFSHDIYALWRGVDDLVGVRGRNLAPHTYTVVSQVRPPDPARLAAARTEDTPPEVLARYTVLPRDLPARVVDLAHQAAGLSDGATPTPYAQARAIEAFLHQYPYTLDLPTPPVEVDIVDYFLFNRQEGFCDYFASAMVVMSRAVGLPARLGVGFLQQPPDDAGVQTVRQINAHSWAEVYFAGYGWVEFEPTPGFASTAPAPASDSPTSPVATYEPPQFANVAVPRRAPQRETPWLALFGLAALALVGWRLWGRRVMAARRAPRPALDAVQLAFAELQTGAAAAGFPYRPGQTPDEFGGGLAAHLAEDVDGAALRPAVERLTHLYTSRQYGRARSSAAGREADATWRRLRAPLRRLRLRRLWSRRK